MNIPIPMLLMTKSFLQNLSVTGYKAHRYPVERLVINHPQVATGAFHQVILWDNSDGIHLQFHPLFHLTHLSLYQRGGAEKRVMMCHSAMERMRNPKLLSLPSTGCGQKSARPHW